MSITVIAPAYYQSLYPVRYLVESAKRHGVDIYWYGLGKSYTDWFNIQLIDILELLPSIKSTHVLYTDASDAILLGNLAEINTKYLLLDQQPILLSRERSGICAGGWIAEKQALKEALEWLVFRMDKFDIGPDPRNPQERWRYGVESGELRKWLGFTPAVDEKSEIFQVVDEPLEIKDGRVYNPRTNRYPSIIHFAGGYSDPQVGKYEIMKDYLIGLGYD